MNDRPNRPIYLDNQATTRCDPRVLAVMLPWFSESFGNPHSAEHVMGRTAEAAVEAARAQVAALIGEDSVVARSASMGGAFGFPVEDGVVSFNAPDIQAAEIPAANGISTA